MVARTSDAVSRAIKEDEIMPRERLAKQHNGANRDQEPQVAPASPSSAPQPLSPPLTHHRTPSPLFTQLAFGPWCSAPLLGMAEPLGRGPHFLWLQIHVLDLLSPARCPPNPAQSAGTRSTKPLLGQLSSRIPSRAQQVLCLPLGMSCQLSGAEIGEEAGGGKKG